MRVCASSPRTSCFLNRQRARKSSKRRWILAAAGAIGFLGTEIAAQVRLRAGRRFSSPAMVADGNRGEVCLALQPGQ